MKRIFITSLLLCICASAQAQNQPDWLETPEQRDIFRVPDRGERPGIKPGRVFLTRQEIDALILPRKGKSQRLPSLDHFTGNAEDELEFERIELYGPNAEIHIVGEQGETIRPHGKRAFYLATNRSTGIGLAVDQGSGEVRGFVKKHDSKLEIQGNLLGALQFTEVVDTGESSCSAEMDNQLIDAAAQESGSFPSQSETESGGVITYEAVIAVETDTEWLAGFGNDEDDAQAWVEDAFLAMNVFYERDLETRLLIGDVFLRTGSDPYTVPSDRGDQLDEFGEYWMNNMDSVDRQFAMMFSGRSISSYSFSGIAWIDAYCDYGWSWSGRTPGSYSYNAIGTNRTPGNTAVYIGHELGHNMGSRHTHCYSPPVDECSTSGSGCFDGDPACPASGHGTIMSYCHLMGGCGSAAEFHPTVQSLIEDRLANELAAGCILPHSSPLGPEIDTAPVAGGSLDFGTVDVGLVSAPLGIRVDNTGDEPLDLSCGLAGPDMASFSYLNCGQTIAAGEGIDLTVTCAPVQGGALSADLQLTSNDADEGVLEFALACQGVEVVLEDLIFSDDFEN